MKRVILTVFLISAIFFLPSFSIQTKENASKSRYVKGQFIVKFKGENPQAAGLLVSDDYGEIAKQIASGFGVHVKNVKKLFPASNNNLFLYQLYGLGRFYVIFTDSDVNITETCKEFESNERVEFSEPDFIGEAAGVRGTDLRLRFKPNDEYFYRQWGLYNDGTLKTTTGKNGKAGADMDVTRGWDIERGSDDVIVAILDSGVKLDHPDLVGRIWVNQKEKANGRDNDNNGFIGDINGWNFAYDNNDVRDDGGHGSNIAGTIGANADNKIGYAGIDHHCKLMVCKDLDEENLGEYSWWSAALYYAANNGAKVINMSEGGFDYSKTLAAAISFANDAGCLICASMMNKNNNDEYYPASFPEVMAIGATDSDDGRCKQFSWGGGSNWGKHISVVAPGNRIYGLDFKDNNNYDVYWSGTSQATAYVTGIAALLLAQDHSRTNKDLRNIITSTAKDQVGDPREDTPGWDEYYGYGRVDLYAALTYGQQPSEDNQDKSRESNSNNNKKNSNTRNGGDSKRAKAEQPGDNGDESTPAKKADH